MDTNVVVYSYDLDDPVKHTVARELIEHLSNQGALVFSTQVFNEFCSAMMSPKRKTRLPPDQLVVILRELAATGQVVPISRTLTFRATRRHAASWPLVLGRTHLVGGRREQSRARIYRGFSRRSRRRGRPIRQSLQ